LIGRDKYKSAEFIIRSFLPLVNEGLPGDILSVYVTGHSHDLFGETSIEPVKLHQHQKGENITCKTN
jgi:predicted transcriptional regulator